MLQIVIKIKIIYFMCKNYTKTKEFETGIIYLFYNDKKLQKRRENESK